MHFNSLEYLLFLPLVVTLYFLLTHRYRWILLLAASYVFYGYWRIEFLLLIIISTSVDYWAGIQMADKPDKQRRKPWLYLSFFVNIGLLLAFKYLGFFNGIIGDVVGMFDGTYPWDTFKLLLPIGISFYTFQSLGYSIDVYQGSTKPERHFGYFALYVSFFPQLVAGPIERSSQLLPQLRTKKVFDGNKAIEGCKLIVWGLFKKLVIADKLGYYVDHAYAQQLDGAGWIWIGMAFAGQSYLDLSAYADIAIGSAKLFGIELSTNFDRPFRVTRMSHLWQRWHISLTQWFYYYLYKGLARRWRGRWKTNIVIYFVVIGFWHGAGWGFILFGLVHALLYILDHYLWRSSFEDKSISWIRRFSGMAWVWIIGSLSLLFYRSETAQASFEVFGEIGEGIAANNYSLSALPWEGNHIAAIVLGTLLFLIVQNTSAFDPRAPLNGLRSKYVRWTFYYLIVFGIIIFGGTTTRDFLYYQF